MMGDMAQEAEDWVLAEECRLAVLADPNCPFCKGQGMYVLDTDPRDGYQRWVECECVRENEDQQ